jgi:hypothetical protein
MAGQKVLQVEQAVAFEKLDLLEWENILFRQFRL